MSRRSASRTDAKTAYQRLSAKQQRFVDEYLVDLNATDAARRAGYSAKSPDTAASKLLAKPDVAAAVLERQRRQREGLEIDEKWVLRELHELYLGLKATKKEAAVRPLELIGKHFAMFTDNVKHSGSIDTQGDDEIDARITELLRKAGTGVAAEGEGTTH